MRMLIEFELNEETKNFFGEYFREQFFNKKFGYGCYQSFELNDDVIKLPDKIEYVKTIYEMTEKEVWTCAAKCINGVPVRMKYHWDGDGTLIFYNDEFYLVNHDCKKANNWGLNNAG